MSNVKRKVTVMKIVLGIVIGIVIAVIIGLIIIKKWLSGGWFG